MIGTIAVINGDNDLITGFSGAIILGSVGLRVIPPFDLRGMLAAVVGGLWPVEFPFSIFGLADDTRSKFFFRKSHSCRKLSATG